jgi:hypothetical protein
MPRVIIFKYLWGQLDLWLHPYAGDKLKYKTHNMLVSIKMKLYQTMTLSSLLQLSAIYTYYPCLATCTAANNEVQFHSAFQTFSVSPLWLLSQELLHTRQNSSDFGTTGWYAARILFMGVTCGGCFPSYKEQMILIVHIAALLKISTAINHKPWSCTALYH